MMTSLPLFEHRPDCTRCPLHSQSPGIPIHVGMAATWLSSSLPPGPNKPAILVVGQNPGAQEDKRGEPFVGKSGELVRNVLIPGANLDKVGSVYLTNAARCYTIGNSCPPEASFKACRDWLADDIARICSVHVDQQLLVLNLGGPAAKTMAHLLLTLDPGTLTAALKLNGMEFVTPQGNKGGFFSTYHPAFVNRKRAYIHPVKDHVTLAAAWLRGQAPTQSQPSLIPVRYPNVGTDN